MTPADLASIEDLTRFQFTLKEELRRNYPFGMFGAEPWTEAMRNEIEAREAARRNLAQNIKSRIGITSDVMVVEPDSIERSLGKAKRVVDLRSKD